MKRRYIVDSKVWIRNGSLRFGTIRKTFKEALKYAKENDIFCPVIESQKLLNGYWETVKIKYI